MRYFYVAFILAVVGGCTATSSKSTYISPSDGALARLTVTAYTQGLYFGGRNPQISFWKPGSKNAEDIEIGRYQFDHKQFGKESISIRAGEEAHFVIEVSEARVVFKNLCHP